MVLQFMPPMENMLLPLQEPIRLLNAFFILLGLLMIKFLLDVVMYEWNYGLGEEFIEHGKEHVKKIISMRNEGIKK